MDGAERKETIVVGSDHAGFDAKEYIKSLLDEMGYPVVDEGTYNEESVDYPDFAEKVGLKVRNNTDILGIISCASGVGIAIAANKIDGVRAALVGDEETARLSREHNDANILAIAGRPYDRENVKRIVSAWLSARFEGGRHARRVEKIKMLEKKYPENE